MISMHHITVGVDVERTVCVTFVDANVDVLDGLHLY